MHPHKSKRTRWVLHNGTLHRCVGETWQELAALIGAGFMGGLALGYLWAVKHIGG